jgi:transcriptional regulator with XRE-family HTH domain
VSEHDLIGQLRGHRRRLGLSQQNVADRMGHGARSIVSDLENGQRAPVSREESAVIRAWLWFQMLKIPPVRRAMAVYYQHVLDHIRSQSRD